MEENCDEVNIHKAAADGKRGLCDELLAQGEDVNSSDQLGWTPLMHAVHNGHTSLARDLLTRGAQVTLRSHHGITAFTMATLNFDEELLTTLYGRLTPELKQQESNMALLGACVNGSYNAVKWLLQTTLAQVNFISPLIGVTPLMLVAMSCEDCEMAELLMQSGADPSISSALGQDAPELALTNGNGKLFMLLNQASPTLTSKPRISLKKVKNNSESLDPMFTINQTFLHVQGEVVLKNSPARPVFKTGDENLSIKTDEEKSLLSPSKRSVFLPSPQSQPWDSDDLKSHYNLAAIVTPSKFVAKTPSKGKKRKLSTVNGISSWLKKVTKRRSKSLADEDDDDDLNTLRQNGVDFYRLLKGSGLEEFFPVFKEQELDIWTFLSLTVQDLAAMGINKASSQIRILAGIQTLRTTQI